MRRNQLLAGIMTAMTVVMPVANVYADSAKDHEVQIAASIEEKKSDIDKAAVLQNSVKMTDRISAVADGKNIMFSPTSLNFALGMIAEGAKGETKKSWGITWEPMILLPMQKITWTRSKNTIPKTRIMDINRN